MVLSRSPVRVLNGTFEMERSNMLCHIEMVPPSKRLRVGFS